MQLESQSWIFLSVLIYKWFERMQEHCYKMVYLSIVFLLFFIYLSTIWLGTLDRACRNRRSSQAVGRFFRCIIGKVHHVFLSEADRVPFACPPFWWLRSHRPPPACFGRLSSHCCCSAFCGLSPPHALRTVPTFPQRSSFRFSLRALLRSTDFHRKKIQTNNASDLRPCSVTTAGGAMWSIKGKLRMLCLCLPLLAGALSGVPMRAEDMEKLNDALHRDTIVYVMPDEEPEDETRAEIRRMMESLAPVGRNAGHRNRSRVNLRFG